MKKWVFVLAIFTLFLGFVIVQNKKEEVVKTHSDSRRSTQTFLFPAPSSTAQTSLFVPYWSISESSFFDGEYKTLLYFGVAANEKGIDREEPGYKNIDTFLALTRQQKKLLVVRMLDEKTNSSVLTDKTEQDVVIKDAIQVAKDKGFDGVVLDYELSALAFDSVTANIYAFYHSFGQLVKTSNLSFHVTMYGDTFYRARPYDVSAIAKDADTVFIMAYDLHKARQNPGPNFPLLGKEQYGYDMEAMLADFTKKVPKGKIAVVFGMFGYDWTLDSKGLGVGIANAMSTKEISNTFLHGCTIKDCVIQRDNVSSETSIRYTDDEGKQHEVWFEDTTSVQKKEKFLEQNGIVNFSFWAYSYY